MWLRAATLTPAQEFDEKECSSRGLFVYSLPVATCYDGRLIRFL